MDCTLLGLLALSAMYIAKIANTIVISSMENSTYINKELITNIVGYLPHIAIILVIMSLKSALSFIRINFKLKKSDLNNTLNVFTDCCVERNEFDVNIIKIKGIVCGAFVDHDNIVNIKADLKFYFRVQSVFFYSIFIENMNTRSFHIASMITALILLYAGKLFINDIPSIDITHKEIQLCLYTISICTAVLFGINVIIRNAYCRISNVYWFLIFFILCDSFFKCIFWIIVAKLDKTFITLHTNTHIHHPSELTIFDFSSSNRINL